MIIKKKNYQSFIIQKVCGQEKPEDADTEPLRSLLHLVEGFWVLIPVK